MHVFSRIVAIADVFDALGCRRAYKEPWPLTKTMAYMASERGRQFDPHLIDLFLAHADEFIAIRAAYPDA